MSIAPVSTIVYQPYGYPQAVKATGAVAFNYPSYVRDRVFLQNTETGPIPKPTPEPYPYPEPGPSPDYSNFKTGLRVAGVLAGGAAIGGTAGYLVSRAMGYTGMAGAVTGGVIGAVVPIAMLIYAIKTFN